MIYNCCNENRKKAVLGNATWNGIDYLEVLDSEAPPGSPRQRTLLVHCLNPLTQSSWSTDNVIIEGGESVTNIALDWVEPALSASPLASSQASYEEQHYFESLPDAASVLVVRTHLAGDFSSYRLRLVNSAAQAAKDSFKVTETLSGFDLQLAEVQFSFKVECGPGFDCAPQPLNCPPASLVPPPINYLAKDYGSFRTIMLDRLSQLLPGWGGSSEADLGVVLAELIAYVGDRLSYQQDAVATEAYIEMARSRVSLRRHALLVDYHVHDGCNARAFIQLQATGNNVFLDHTKTRFYTLAPGVPPSVAVGSVKEKMVLSSGVQIFEPMQDANLFEEQNQMNFYTWRDTDCCLPKGATEATLKGSLTSLQPGDVLIFQEMKGPKTGDPADADVRRRCAVRLTQVATRDGRGNLLQDSLFDSSTPVPVTEIQWSTDDALPFPVCLSSSFIDDNGDTQGVEDVSVAFGNVVLVDHGLRVDGKPLGEVPQPRLWQPPDPAADRCAPKAPTPIPVRYRPTVPDKPITQAVPLPLAGNPVTSAVVPLQGMGFVSLEDSKGEVCLMVRANEPLTWPQFFAVVVKPNLVNPSNFDLQVVYVPSPDQTGLPSEVILEEYSNLSLAPAELQRTATQINSLSQMIRVQPPVPLPASVPSGFAQTPLILPNTGTVALQDLSSPPVPYLIIQTTNPAVWPQSFGVLAQGNTSDPSSFGLVVVYDPASGGVGVNLPVSLELFTTLSIAPDRPFSLKATSQLISVLSFAQTPNPSLSAHDLMNFGPAEAVPVITLTGTLDGIPNTWKPLQDLLESAETDPVFVVEVEADGTATLRFGDDANGKRPDSGTVFTASYRVGNGTAGNVGADSILGLDVPPGVSIDSCRNPLPAVGGTEPETNDQICRRAPQAFQTQERAVTMPDYEAAAELNPQVARAAASLRWTGSWYTVFIAVEPKGGGSLGKTLTKNLKKSVGAYRLAGQDLELDSPQYVSLEIVLAVCVDPDYIQSDVEQALLEVLSNRALANGRKGVFHSDNFTFGQTVYLSPVYAAARSVAGVRAVHATTFQPQGVNSPQYLDAGEMKLGPLQVARLDNDPNFPNHGRLTIILEGGK